MADTKSRKLKPNGQHPATPASDTTATTADTSESAETNPQTPANGTSAPTNMDQSHVALDLAWVKITKGREQEAEGRKLWVEGTLELIQILDALRKLYASDQAFGAALDEAGYGEDRISRQDRAALLNMAVHLDVTRRVLEQTSRRSWRHIWEQEIQPGLPHVGQPPEQGAEATDVKPAKGEESKAATPTPDKTRRPRRKRGKRETEPEWSSDSRGWFGNLLDRVNDLTKELNAVMAASTREQHAKQAAALEPELLSDAVRNLDATCAKYEAYLSKPWDEATAMLTRESRVRTTPRAPVSKSASAQAPAQPGA